MGLEQLTFLQGLSELERSVLLAHAHPTGDCFPNDVIGDVKCSRAQSSDKSECEQLRQQLKGERDRRQLLEAQVSSLQAALSNQATELDELRSSRNLLRQRTLRNDEQGSRLAASISSLEQENASLSARLLAASNERAQLVSKLETMQARVSELQQNCVSMASCCEDGVDRRDILRRSKLGGLLRDVAASGALDADLHQSLNATNTSLERPTVTNKMAGSTIAALTRERDALQQRVNELSGRLADAVGREGAARGAQALRSAGWKRSAVQAEAKLAAALKRVKDLSEDLRKRELEARQRDKYTSQLERTVMAQHKSLQQQRRMLESGAAGVASATATGATAARVGGPHQDDAALSAGGQANKATASDKAAASQQGAPARDAAGTGTASMAAAPSSAAAGGGGSSAASGGAVGSGVGGNGGMRLVWPGLSEGHEALQPRGRYSPNNSPPRQQQMQLQPQQSAREQQPHSQQHGGLHIGGSSSCWSSPESPSDCLFQPGAARGHAFDRGSADGGDPWVLPPLPALPSNFNGRMELSARPLVLQQQQQQHSQQPLRQGPQGAGRGHDLLHAGEQAASPVDLVGSCMPATATAAGTRTQDMPAAPNTQSGPLQQQLNHVEASLAQLYRELEEFKDYSMQRCPYGEGQDGREDFSFGADMGPGAMGGGVDDMGAFADVGDSDPGSPAPMLHRCTTPPRRTRSSSVGPGCGGPSDGMMGRGEEEEEECSRAPTFAFPSSPTMCPVGSSRQQQHRPGEGSTARTVASGRDPRVTSPSARAVSAGEVRRSVGMEDTRDGVRSSFFHAPTLPGGPPVETNGGPQDSARRGYTHSDDGSVDSRPHRPSGSAVMAARAPRRQQQPLSASWAGSPLPTGRSGRVGGGSMAVRDYSRDEVESSVAASCGSSVRQPERDYYFGADSQSYGRSQPAPSGPSCAWPEEAGGTGGGPGACRCSCCGSEACSCGVAGACQEAYREDCGRDSSNLGYSGGRPDAAGSRANMLHNQEAQGSGVGGALTVCPEEEDEQPRQQPPPSHVLGHHLRCALPHGYTSPRENGPMGRAPSNRAPGMQAVRPAGASNPNSSAAAPASTGGKYASSAAHTQHGSPGARVNGAEELARILRSGPAAGAALSQRQDGSAQQHQQQRPGAQGSQAQRGHAAWVQRPSGSGRSPGAAPSGTGLSSARSPVEPTGAVTSRTVGRHGENKEQRFGPRSAHVRGTWAPSGASQRASSLRNSVNVAADLPSSPRTPTHGSGPQERQPAGATAATGAANGSSPPRPASPQDLSPISTLLANITSGSSREPRASASTTSHSHSHSHSAAQRTGSNRQQFDDVSSAPAASQPPARPAAAATPAMPAANERARNNSNSSSCMTGPPSSQRRSQGEMWGGANDARRMTRGSGAGSSTGSAAGPQFQGNYAAPTHGNGGYRPFDEHGEAFPNAGGAGWSSGSGPDGGVRMHPDIPQQPYPPLSGPVEVEMLLPSTSEGGSGSECRGGACSERPTLGGWLAEATSRAGAPAMAPVAEEPFQQQHHPSQQQQQQQHAHGAPSGGGGAQGGAAAAANAALQRLRDKRMQRTQTPQQQAQLQQQQPLQLTGYPADSLEEDNAWAGSGALSERRRAGEPRQHPSGSSGGGGVHPREREGSSGGARSRQEFSGGSGSGSTGGGTAAAAVRGGGIVLPAQDLQQQQQQQQYPGLAEEGSLRALREAMRVSVAGSTSSRGSAGGLPAAAAGAAGAVLGGDVSSGATAAGLAAAEGREGSSGSGVGAGSSNSTREYSSGGGGGGSSGGANGMGALSGPGSSYPTAAMEPLPAAHPLMQLLGQASADLQLLSNRLKPLVGGGN